MEIVKGYTKNLNVQMLISLMQAHGIHKVIISPGGTHNEIIMGFQYNGSFELYSTVDERGAAYMAVGMAAASQEPVAIICTESVASRNYLPAMTEAYYRQLPVLAITGVHSYSKIGHLHSQIIDRTVSPIDTFIEKVHLSEIKNSDDVWASNILINRAILALKHHGGGPVHIDLPRNDDREFASYTEKQLIQARVIRRYSSEDLLPEMNQGKVAVFIGTHQEFTKKQTETLDQFCASHDAIVFCGHTSGYHGKYRVLTNLLAAQHVSYDVFKNIDLLIHIGGPAADEKTLERLCGVHEVWRVNPDGEIRDTFRSLTNVFEMNDDKFFSYYSKQKTSIKDTYLKCCLELISCITIPNHELPFSNVYAASKLADKIPKDSFVFVGGSSTMRAWSLFDFPQSVSTMANMGTRGIDGVLSSFLGVSFLNREKLCYCILGDLTFFYDMNAIGNRDLSKNVRILLVNDGGGGLFKLKGTEQNITIGDKDTDPYIAAVGHFGNQSRTLVKSYAESLGFEYMTASNKEEFDSVYERFVTPEMTDMPMLFELFTNSADERKAFDIMSNLVVSIGSTAKQAAKRVLGTKGVNALKKLLNNDKKN